MNLTIITVYTDGTHLHSWQDVPDDWHDDIDSKARNAWYAHVEMRVNGNSEVSHFVTVIGGEPAFTTTAEELFEEFFDLDICIDRAPTG